MESKEKEQVELSQEEQAKVFDNMQDIFSNNSFVDEEGIEQEKKVESKEDSVEQKEEFAKQSQAEAENEIIKETKSNTLVDISELPDDMKDYYLASKEEGFDKEKYYEQKQRENNILNLSDVDFMKNYYKSNYGKSEEKPTGLTDEEIAEDISKMSRLQLKAESEKLRGQLVEYLNTKKTERLSKIPSSKYDSKEYLERIENTITKNKEVKNVFGLDISDAKGQVDEAFRQYNKLNPETGKTPLQEMLEDDDMRYNVVALINTSKLAKGKLSEMKEKIKSDIIKKLGIEPEGEGGLAMGSTGEFNPDIFV